MKEIKVPQVVAATITLVTWHKDDGADVEFGEPLADIRLEGTPGGEVDCDVLLPSPATGRLKVMLHCGAIVFPGQQLGSVD